MSCLRCRKLLPDVSPMNPSPSKLDTDRFGIPTVKGLVSRPDSVGEILTRCTVLGAKLAILRVPVELHEHVRELEKAGSILCDTLVYTRRTVTDEPPGGLADGLNIREANPADAAAVSQVAAEAFRDYDSHYRNDPNLRAEDVAEVYPSWAANCCTTSGAADKVLLVESQGRVIAFGALKKIANDCADGVLFGVLPGYRGRGILTSLVEHSMAWGLKNGCKNMEYSTHLTNLAALKAVTKLGFVIDRSAHTFHKWF
jgi:GNAT superfamily N-acetyltransferase